MISERKMRNAHDALGSWLCCWVSVRVSSRPSARDDRSHVITVASSVSVPPADFYVTEIQRKTVVRHRSVGIRFGIPTRIQHRRGERPTSGESRIRRCVILVIRMVFFFIPRAGRRTRREPQNRIIYTTNDYHHHHHHGGVPVNGVLLRFLIATSLLRIRNAMVYERVCFIYIYFFSFYTPQRYSDSIRSTRGVFTNIFHSCSQIINDKK